MLATVITALFKTVFVKVIPATLGVTETEKVLLPVPLVAVTVSVMGTPDVIVNEVGVAVSVIAGLTVTVTDRNVVAPTASVTVTVSKYVPADNPLPKFK